jgi:hypothetical protein
MKQAISRLTDHWKMKWSTFSYNYRWSDYVAALDGWIAKSAMTVPIVGYLILFNDSVSEHLSFNTLASGKFVSAWFIVDRETEVYLFRLGPSRFREHTLST